jgi:hypothetical protein
MHEERFSTKNYDSHFAGREEVADSRTPLSALIDGEADERTASNAVVNQAAARVAERLTERLAETLGEMVESDVEFLTGLLIAEMEAEILEVRLITLRTMLRYLWQSARNPWDAMKTLLAVTRLVSSSLIRGASQTDVAFLLRETKGATRAREKRDVEALLQKWGVQGFHLEGGQKSESARQIYAEVQKGNRNRAKSKEPNKERKQKRK